jgi:serine O-acetyltransferase
MNALIENFPPIATTGDCAPVVERLAELRRQAQRRRYPGATPQLPSRWNILALTETLLGAVYPRHFSGGVANDDLDDHVARTLSNAVPALEREIKLELALPSNSARLPWGEPAEIAAEFIQALPQVRELVDLDIRAALAADPTQGDFDELVFCSASVAAILRHRLAHELYRLGAPLAAKIIAADLRSRTGIDIHPGAEIGEGFSIVNAAGLTIGETAVIGRNVRLHAPVTLGDSFAIASVADNHGVALGVARTPASADTPARRHPLIEDDVVIEAGASLFGPITVGRGSTIGRNVWVLEDVPPLSHVEAKGA